jgi:hypothetical protein
MNRKIHLASAALAVITAGSALAGCHSKSTTASVPPAGAVDPTLSQAEMVDLCVNLHSKAAACPAEFTKLNIDLRIKYSPEFAQMMQDPAVRQQAQAEGVAETSADAANARERCTEFAKPEWGAAQPRSDLARLDTCYAMSSCDGKMQCLQPLIEPRFAYRATHGQPGQH